MSERSEELERRLREKRYNEAARSSVQVLEGLGIGEADRVVLALEEVESIWSRFLTRLRGRAGAAERWPASQSQSVQDRLDSIAERVDGMRVIWLMLADSEPVGVELPAAAPLRAALTYFVSRTGDLMLTSRDGSDGICLELNRRPTGDEYEVVAWGAFAE